jgi:NitT/TauT family transport system substrate-binding protein
MKHLLVCALAGSLCLPLQAWADQTELHISRAIPITALVMIVTEGERLIEKHAAAAGIPDLKVTWHSIGGGPAIQVDALLAGNVDIISAGMTSILTLWAKTKGRLDIKAITGQSTTPLRLVTRNPNVKTIRDLTDSDRIAVPSVKISFHAMLLQMAAAKEWGKDNATRLDRLTVSMPPAEAMATMVSGKGEITTDMNSPPFMQVELATPGIREILSQDDILEGKANGLLTATTGKFHDSNPKIMKAFVAALAEACDIIRSDKEKAADIYLRVTGAKNLSRDLILRVLNDPKSGYEITPSGTKKIADFMYETGLISEKLEKWQDLFFPEIHSQSGS